MTMAEKILARVGTRAREPGRIRHRGGEQLELDFGQPLAACQSKETAVSDLPKSIAIKEEGPLAGVRVREFCHTMRARKRY